MAIPLLATIFNTLWKLNLPDNSAEETRTAAGGHAAPQFGMKVFSRPNPFLHRRIFQSKFSNGAKPTFKAISVAYINEPDRQKTKTP